jgi:hypothetical protein
MRSTSRDGLTQVHPVTLFVRDTGGGIRVDSWLRVGRMAPRRVPLAGGRMPATRPRQSASDRGSGSFLSVAEHS